jgi:hypothetical protein
MVQNKRKQTYDKAWNEVAHLPTAMWSVPQLKAIVSYKKLKTDKRPLLKNRAQRLEKWEEEKDCAVLEGNAEPTHTRCKLVRRIMGRCNFKEVYLLSTLNPTALNTAISTYCTHIPSGTYAHIRKINVHSSLSINSSREPADEA